jgi:hypothetical protein
MVPGSYLVISAGSSENLPDTELAEIHAAYARTPQAATCGPGRRSRRCSAGFELVEPGVVDVCHWRGFERPTHVSILAGVARRVDDGRHGDGRADGTPPPP